MFTDSERRAYALLRKNHERWKYMRLLALLIGVGIVVTAVWLRLEWEQSLMVYDRLHDDETDQRFADLFFSTGRRYPGSRSLSSPSWSLHRGLDAWSMGRAVPR